MSEFTTGVLYPCKYEPKLLLHLSRFNQPYFHKNINEGWNAFFLEDEWLETADTIQFLLRLSNHHIPLLWFHDAEETGWGYRLFDGGAEVSSATISYELDIEMTEEILAKRYPTIEIAEEVIHNDKLRQEYDEVLHQVVHSDRFQQEVGKGISRFRPQSFNRFLSHKQVQQLCSLFDVSMLTEFDDDLGSSLLYDSVDLFKEILGIEEMMWVNYAYLASGGRE
ncbi:hypothetical protein ACQCN2_07465 [Brevibacillus ginsengisoli]|uniref:hypothetical protein n=1 Tax=Brevibacillus ginsengisoli TaxID=363854 RepID=UPI003CF802F5